jgi:Cof subfamily protein (haloacid dehalogenase superfamily)
MSLPIICFDLDGTLLDKRGRIHPGDVALLAASDAPARFVPSTGRPLESVRRAFARNNLYVDQPFPLPLVLLNGSLVVAEHEAPLAFHPLDEAIQRELVALSMQFQSITFWFLSPTDIFVLWPNPLSDGMAKGFDFTMQPFSDSGGRAHFSKIMCVSESPSALEDLAQTVAAFPIEAARSMSTVLELTPHSVDKGTGIRELLQRIDVHPSFYAAGDGENDLPLFQVATLSFAPATAPERIRAAASQVIDVSREGLLAPILRCTL